MIQVELETANYATINQDIQICLLNLEACKQWDKKLKLISLCLNCDHDLYTAIKDIYNFYNFHTFYNQYYQRDYHLVHLGKKRNTKIISYIFLGLYLG